MPALASHTTWPRRWRAGKRLLLGCDGCQHQVLIRSRELADRQGRDMRPPLLKRNLRSFEVRQLPEDLVAVWCLMRRSSLASLTSIELFRMRGRMEMEVRDGDDEPAALLVPGERWIIGPVTFNVFKWLDNDSLNAAENIIRKIAKMLKCKALLDGDEMRPGGRAEGVRSPRDRGSCRQPRCHLRRGPSRHCARHRR